MRHRRGSWARDAKKSGYGRDGKVPVERPHATATSNVRSDSLISTP